MTGMNQQAALPQGLPNDDSLHKLVQALAAGHLDVEKFVGQFQKWEAERDTFQVDFDRASRCGFPEVVYGSGKTPAAISAIFQALLSRGQDAFATRIEPAIAAELQNDFPQGQYHPVARTFRVDATDRPNSNDVGRVAVVTAGTSDLPVAEEALATLQWMRVAAHKITDVGVAGPHRLYARQAELRGCDAIVVVAGMEGALPSIVAGYVDCPVIGVPTSVGYGAAMGGIAALLSMLNSCAANVSVVNIDAGFKGGYLAGMITRQKYAARTDHSGTE